MRVGIIQWDEGVVSAVQEILSRQGDVLVEVATLIEIFDRHEHALETE